MDQCNFAMSVLVWLTVFIYFFSTYLIFKKHWLFGIIWVVLVLILFWKAKTKSISSVCSKRRDTKRVT